MCRSMHRRLGLLGDGNARSGRGDSILDNADVVKRSFEQLLKDAVF